jgi:hypothetical protein
VVTNAADLALPLLTGRRAIVLSITPVPGTPVPGTPSVHVIESPTADEMAALLPPDGPLHVRCLVDVSRLVDAHDQARLHDLAFLAAQQVARRGGKGSSVLTVLFAGLSATGTPAPVVGLFTGLVKSISLELESAVVRCVVTDRSDLAAALAEMVGETALTPTLPGVWYRGGERLVPRIVRAPRRGRRPLIVTDDDVVVAVGGARGITAEVLKDLTTTVRPTIFVIGRKDLDGDARRLQEHGGPDGLASRATFISSWRRTSPGRSVGEANARYEQLTEVADSLRTLALLRDRCGAGRVRYLAADVMDATATRVAVDEILAAEDHVGLLLYAAGANRASALATKTLADFRFVRDVKHLGYLNVRAAFGDRLPRTWINFGSFIGLTGQIGEPDYASGNDFLDMAAVAHSREGLDERTIGWAYWREVGLGANAVMAAFLEKSGLYTPMSTREGVRHFRAELGSEPLPLMFQFGDLELAAVRDKIPGAIRDESRPSVAPSVAATPSPPALPPFVSRVALREEGRCDVEVDFRPSAFGLLEHHLVRGRATLPGMFVPEMAAEAAAILEPSRVVVGFRNIAFRRFLRLEAESLPGSTKRVEARTVRRDRESTVVRGRGGRPGRVPRRSPVARPGHALRARRGAGRPVPRGAPVAVLASRGRHPGAGSVPPRGERRPAHRPVRDDHGHGHHAPRHAGPPAARPRAPRGLARPAGGAGDGPRRPGARRRARPPGRPVAAHRRPPLGGSHRPLPPAQRRGPVPARRGRRAVRDTAGARRAVVGAEPLRRLPRQRRGALRDERRDGGRAGPLRPGRSGGRAADGSGPGRGTGMTRSTKARRKDIP